MESSMTATVAPTAGERWQWRGHSVGLRATPGRHVHRGGIPHKGASVVCRLEKAGSPHLIISLTAVRPMHTNRQPLKPPGDALLTQLDPNRDPNPAPAGFRHRRICSPPHGGPNRQ